MAEITAKEFMDSLKVISDLELSNNIEAADFQIQELYKKVGNHPLVLHTKGIIAYKRGRYKEGITFVEAAIKLDSNNPLYYRNIIELYRYYGRLDDALNAARKSVELTPDDFICNFNLAVIHMERNEYDECIVSLQRCLELKPDSDDVKFCMAEVALLLGNLKEGIELYESRYGIVGAKNTLPSLTAPVWSNEPLDNKTILIIGDQGYGDTIQFGRFIPLLIEKGYKVKLGVSKELTCFFNGLPESVSVGNNITELGDYDIVIPTSSLMKFCYVNNIDMYSVPNTFLGKPIDESKWTDIISNLDKRKFKIGLAWAGRPTHKNDKKRSMQLSKLKPFLDDENLEIYSLQKDLPSLQIGQYNQFKCAFSDCNQSLESWEDTIALIKQMDMIVTVDTSIAHVAGLFDIPTILLLPSAPDWRWGLNTDKSKWYKSITIFRQKKATQWEEPINEAYTYAIKYLNDLKSLENSLVLTPPNSIFDIAEPDEDNPEVNDIVVGQASFNLAAD
jgi:tetratricopeptide (TPR) repeat protein